MRIKEKFKFGDDEPGQIYVMSDLHYNHENILKMSDRPFSNVTAMNEYIKSQLGSLGPEDVVFDLGDMFWNVGTTEIYEVLGGCKAKIYKVIGNHDKPGLYYKYGGGSGELAKFFVAVADLMDVCFVDSMSGVEYLATLCHYPMLSWYRKAYGSIMISGHTHGNLDDYHSSQPELRVDVGWDGREFCGNGHGSFLVPVEKIIEHMNKKTGGLSFRDYAQNKNLVV